MTKNIKIQYCSDLHLKFSEKKAYFRKNPIEPVVDDLVLEWDGVPFEKIGKFKWFFTKLSKKFGIFWWIPENHEYYRNDLTLR